MDNPHRSQFLGAWGLVKPKRCLMHPPPLVSARRWLDIPLRSCERSGAGFVGGGAYYFLYYYRASRNAHFFLPPSFLENLDIILFIFRIPFSGTIRDSGV